MLVTYQHDALVLQSTRVVNATQLKLTVLGVPHGDSPKP